MNMMLLNSAKSVTLGEITRKFGITPRALRLYDELGLVVAERDSLNRRVYPPSAQSELEVIHRLRAAGVSLTDARCALVAGRQQGALALRRLALHYLETRAEKLDAQRRTVEEATAWMASWAENSEEDLHSEAGAGHGSKTS